MCYIKKIKPRELKNQIYKNYNLSIIIVNINIDASVRIYYFNFYSLNDLGFMWDIFPFIRFQSGTVSIQNIQVDPVCKGMKKWFLSKSNQIATRHQPIMRGVLSNLSQWGYCYCTTIEYRATLFGVNAKVCGEYWYRYSTHVLVYHFLVGFLTSSNNFDSLQIKNF